MLKNSSDTIEYLADGILIGNKHFKNGESINIGNDVLVRTNGMYSEQVKQHIKKSLGHMSWNNLWSNSPVICKDKIWRL